MKKTKWFVYTVLVGLIPFLTRLLMYSVTNEANASFAINEGDFISLGLVLSITNINELEHESSNIEPNWRTVCMGISIALICFFAVLFALSALHGLKPGIFSIAKIKAAAIGLSACAGIFSYTIYDRLSKTGITGGAH